MSKHITIQVGIMMSMGLFRCNLLVVFIKSIWFHYTPICSMVLVYLPIKLGDFVWANVGKSSSTMEHMGQLLVYILSYSPREAGGKTWPQELRNRLLYNNRWVHYIGGYRYIHIELKPDLGLCIWYLVKYGYIIYIHISNISIVIVGFYT